MPGQTDNTDILQALNQVIEAINDLETTVSESGTTVNCSPDVTVNCGGGGVNGGGNINGPSLGAPRPGTPVIDTDPAPNLPVPTDPPPGGFETWEEYDAYKCKAANALFDSCLGWFRFLGGLNASAAGATAGAVFGAWLLAQIGAALAAAAATTVAGGFAVTSALSAAFLVGFLASAPAWAIGAIVAAIAAITAAVGIGFLIVFDSLADEFEAKREDVVCQLYEAQGVNEARGYLSTALNDALNSFVISPPYDTFEATIRAVGSTILGYMLPNSFINQLFEPSSTVEAYTAGQIDCGQCGCNVFINLGTLISKVGNTYTIGSVAGGTGPFYQVVDIYFSPSGNTVRCDTDACLEVISFAGWQLSANPGDNDWFISSTTQTEYESDTPPTGTYNWTRFNAVGIDTSPWTLVIDITELPCA